MAHEYKKVPGEKINVSANVRPDVYEQLSAIRTELVKSGVVRVSWGDVVNYMAEEIAKK
ncbi:hypothetical protein [Liquorilactobacillus satsumensis]|uniref:hypothetical protein n=1 Tax=Liquorilactobacillus satsumensis TaxID=259059 RepID=UPI0039EB91F1